MKKITSLREVKRRSNPEPWIAALPTVAHDDRKKERGTVFMYILLAVALLAALSYAVSRGNRGSTSLLTDQQAKLAAQEIIDYGNTVATAVQKLRLRGCSDTEVSFENNIIAGYTNASSPPDKSCHVFDIAGGGLSFNAPPDNSFDQVAFAGEYFYSARMNINGIGNTNLDADSSELYMQTNYLKKSVCQNINNILGTNVSGKDTPEVSDTNWSIKFIGTYAYTYHLADTDITSKTTFCAENTGFTGLYQYVHVFIAR